MSTNLYQRLTRLLPTSVVQVGQVTAHHPTDDTSTVLLPAALALLTYAPGVAVGSSITARGRTVPVGGYALVRDGIIVAASPSNVVSDVPIGAVAAQPFGPQRLEAITVPMTLPAGQVGVAYSQSVLASFTGGYPPLVCTLATGTLPAGLALSASGLLAGTPTSAGSRTFTVRATDATRRQATSATITIVIA